MVKKLYNENFIILRKLKLKWIEGNQKKWAKSTETNAFDDLPADRDVDLVGGEVVEEEERLGAVRENVVDAHRHQVDSDRVVLAELLRYLLLAKGKIKVEIL